MKLQMVQEATTSLAAARTPADIARVTVTIGAEALGATSAIVWLRDENGKLKLAESCNVDPEYLVPFQTLAIDRETPAGIVALTHESVWIESREEFQTLTPAMYERSARFDRIKAFCVLPLIIGNDVAAVVGFTYDAPHRFTDDERYYLQTFTRTAEVALERARLFVEIAEASHAKDAFLAMLGHELRNPLSPIVSALELLKMRHGGAVEREIVMIDKHVQRLRRLVDDLLDVSRIVRGRIQLQRQAVVLADVVDEALEQVGVLLVARNQAVNVAVDRSAIVDADRERLLQILRHVMMNATSYTPEGGRIEITARGDGGQWVLEVRDNGRGIDHDLLPRVFDMFTQQPQASNRADGGLGLGLAIVKNLVELHDGKVAIASDGPGHGTAVTIHWPQAQAQAS